MRRYRTSNSVQQTVALLTASIGITAYANEVHANEFVVVHDANGQGSARVFDGGLARSADDHTLSPEDPRMSFLASDNTRPGTFGASASARGVSEILYVDVDFIRVRVVLDAIYFPSDAPDGDRPGGTADAELSSTIQFRMPAADLGWYYRLHIEESSGFTGSTNITVRNITQSETILQLTSEQRFVETILEGNTGDLIVITSDIVGSGTGPAGLSTPRLYGTSLRMDFWVPEPSTISLLLGGILILARRRRALCA